MAASTTASTITITDATVATETFPGISMVTNTVSDTIVTTSNEDDTGVDTSAVPLFDVRTPDTDAGIDALDSTRMMNILLLTSVGMLSM